MRIQYQLHGIMAVKRSKMRRIKERSNAIPKIEGCCIGAFAVFHGVNPMLYSVIIYNFYRGAPGNFIQIKKNMETIKIPNGCSTSMNCLTKLLKQAFIVMAVAVCLPISSIGQASLTGVNQPLTPVRGNYRLFASLSAAPRAANLDVDKLRFPFDQAWADKVLSANRFT